MMKLILKWCAWLILLLMVFGSGIYCGYWLSYKEDFSIVGAADHHLRDKIFVRALDGYFSLSNRYLVQNEGESVRLFHAFSKHYRYYSHYHPVLSSIRISRYKGDKETLEWVNKYKEEDSLTVNVISDDLIEHNVRRIHAKYLFNASKKSLESVHLIKGKSQVRIIGDDAFQVSRKIMESYKPDPDDVKWVQPQQK